MDATTPNTAGSAMCGIVVSMLAVVCKGMQQLLTLLGQQCLELLCPCWQWCAKGCDNSNIVASAMFGIVVSMLAVVCKGMQQLPTLLGQQCLESLCPCWQWCAKGCNNSQQYLDLQCIVGRIQPIRLSNNKCWGLLVQQLGVFHQQCCVHLYGALFLVT